MPLTTQQQDLFTVAKEALPPIIFQDGMQQELISAYAVVFSSSEDQAKTWLAQTFILTASGIWLDQHARDRNTLRQSGESDAALASRLRTFADAVNVSSITARVNAIQTADGFGNCTLVELRQNTARVQGASGIDRGFINRGWRVGAAGTGPANNVIIVILPYATSTATSAAVAEAVRLVKAGGITAIIETRLHP